MMDSSVHTASCAFLVCAEAFLSQGIERLIKERHPDNQKLASEDVCRLCCAVVHAQSKDLLLNLNTLLNRYECSFNDESQAFVKTEHELLQDRSISSGLYTSFCEESIGKHGRSLVVNHSVSRGHVLLKESPYAAVKSGRCACSVGNILTEHITLANTILQSKATNAEKYSRFLKSFYSGLSSKPSAEKVPLGRDGAQDTVQGSAERKEGVSEYKHRSTNTHSNNSGDSIIREGSNVWPLRTQILMALVCAIRNMYSAHTEYTTHYGALNDYSNLPTTSTTTHYTGSVDYKERFFCDTWELMQILCRLPHNTHAISSVVSSKQTSGQSSTSSREVQQVRLGYAVFLHASSINHGCKPNANIRYTTLPYKVSSVASSGVYAVLHGVNHTTGGGSGTSSVSSVDPTLQYLRNVQIEIVSTTSIPSHQLHRTDCEVCVSYGPLHGIHNVVQRQSVLQEQYLFRCECVACVDETTVKHQPATNYATNTSINTTTNTTTNTTYPINTSNATMHTVTPLVHSAVHHIHTLSQPQNDTTLLSSTLSLLKQQLAELNTLFTTVVHHVQSDPQNVPLLQSFETKKLKPINDKLLYLQSTFYPADVKLTDTQGYSVVCNRSGYLNDALYVDYCAVYCTYLDIYAHIYALKSQYIQASKYIHYAITLMVSSRMYDHLDVVIGRERVKLAGVLLSAGNKRDCGVQVKCALDILIPVVSRDDPDVTEAKHMLAFCRA